MDSIHDNGDSVRNPGLKIPIINKLPNNLDFLQLDEEHPTNLIPRLCQQFYDIGWFAGTSGSMSMTFR